MRNNADDWWLPETELISPIKIFLADATIARYSIFDLVDRKKFDISYSIDVSYVDETANHMLFNIRYYASILLFFINTWC